MSSNNLPETADAQTDDTIPNEQDILELWNEGGLMVQDLYREYGAVHVTAVENKYGVSFRDNPAIEEDENGDLVLKSGDTDIVSGSASDEVKVKNLTLTDENSPLAQETGTTGPRQRQVDEEWLADILADQIYDSNSVFIREFLQNAEAACLRAAKLIVQKRPEFEDGWLTRDFWIDAKSGERVGDGSLTQQEANEANDGKSVRRVSLPRKLEEVVEAARSVGYDPTITISLYRDEREIVIEDNGIGMTAHEFDQAFNYTGRSGSKLDSETGGKWGMGALTFGNFTGKDGGMTTTSRTRRDNVPEYNYEGLKAYTYLGGYNEMPNTDIPDDFRGTRFEVPIKAHEDGGPKMSNIHEWVQEYAGMLRVPVLYREFENGQTPVKEEYGGESIVAHFTDDDGNEPPLVLERPGEFTVIAGPDLPIGRVSYNDHRPDTWLVSMPIERNAQARVRSFWDVGIQIHNEQGICVSGPHRGMLRENVDEVHDKDVFTPQPTADRDRLNKDYDNKRFFEYLNDVVAEHEMAEVADIFEEMVTSGDPMGTIRNSASDWTLFKRMVNYHGSNATRSYRRFREFIEDREALMDINFLADGKGPITAEEQAVRQIHYLFKEVSHAPASVSSQASTKKKRRQNHPVGDILSKVPPENVFMAASTGGNFRHQRAVVEETFEKWDVVVVPNASKYGRYEERFGFKYLKEVPLVRSDEHDFDIPEWVHEAHKKVKSGSSKNHGKPDDIGSRVLKFRHDTDSQKIDARMTIEQVRAYLENGKKIGGRRNVVLFPGGKDYPNISDNYYMARFAAIASCTQEEYASLSDLERVFTPEEFYEWSASTAIATEDGGMTVEELMADDRCVVLLWAEYRKFKEMLSDDPIQQRLRRYFVDDILDQRDWELLSDDDKGRPEGLFAVADTRTLRRAQYAFWRLQTDIESRDEKARTIRGVRENYHKPSAYLPNRVRLNESYNYYKNRAETPYWRDDSRSYYLLGKKNLLDEVLRGAHDAGFDATLLTAGEIRRAVSQLDPSDLKFYGDERGDDADDSDDGDDSDDSDDTLGDLFG